MPACSTWFNILSNEKFLTSYTDYDNITSMKTIMIKNVPEQLRNEFKAICVRKGSTMSAEFLKFMKQIVEKENKK